MGVMIVANTSDFSANPVGHVGLTTSVSAGLQSLFELRKTASKATNNSAPSRIKGSVVGTPGYYPDHLTVSPANSVLFPSKPANGGLTIATVVKSKLGGSTSDHVVGSDITGSAVNGSVTIHHYNRRTQLTPYHYAMQSSPLSGYAQLGAYLDLAAGLDGTYQLFVGVLEDEVSARLYHPKSGAVHVKPVAAGRFFSFDAPAAFRTASAPSGGSHDVGLFAHWNRPLTLAEINTFYAEMVTQFAALGVTL